MMSLTVIRSNPGFDGTRLDLVAHCFSSIAACILLWFRDCAKVLRDAGIVWKLMWRRQRDFRGAFPIESGARSPANFIEETKWSVSSSDIFGLVAEDIRKLNNNLQSIVGPENPILQTAAGHIFGAGGKRLRPALVFLVSRAVAEISGQKDLKDGQRRLAEIVEMLHTASLIHDDIIDESGMRRGKQTVHQMYGTRLAVLTGDYMFARSTMLLADLHSFDIIKLLAEVIGDLVGGEIKQASTTFNCDIQLDEYLTKSYCKTGSLFAAGTKGAAMIAGSGADICEQMHQYGRNLGLAFQVVDDVLDFTQTARQLGKPVGSDLARGILTAPVIFALQKQTGLRAVIESEFRETGSLDEAVEMVRSSGGIDRARDLARQIADEARRNLECLPSSSFRAALERMVDYTLEQIK